MSHAAKPATKVLIVEDEPIILMGAVDLVEDAGFQTYSAGSAGAALMHLEANSDIGVLFTDIEMPGSMNGLQLSHFVKERWPAMGILVASGMTNIRADDLPEGAFFFSKPYLVHQIISCLHDFSRNNFSE